MIEVQILTTCEHCGGEAYLPIGEAESCTGEQRTRAYLLQLGCAPCANGRKIS